MSTRRAISADTGHEIVVSTQLRAKYKLEPRPETIKFRPKYFPTFQEAMGGFMPGELISISGPTGAGKTLFAQTLTHAFCDAGVPMIFFSYEVPARQFIESFPDDMFPRFFLMENLHANSLDWFEKKTQESWKRFGCKVVFIDHLHFLFDMAKQNSSLDIGGYMRRIKRFAVNNDLIIFLLCHLTKVEPDQEIGLNQIRDSSFIPQESDSVVIIRRFNDNNESQIKICKHRRTGHFNYKIKLIKRYGYLWEVTDKDKYPTQ